MKEITMLINPVTVTVSRHHLELALAALQHRLSKLTPGGFNYDRAENALLHLQDALEASKRK